MRREKRVKEYEVMMKREKERMIKEQEAKRKKLD